MPYQPSIFPLLLIPTLLLLTTAIPSPTQAKRRPKTAKTITFQGTRAELTLTLSPHHPVILQLPEPPTFSTSDQYIRAQAVDDVLILKLNAAPPPGHTFFVKAPSFSAILHIQTSRKRADTHVTLTRGDRSDVEAAAEHAITRLRQRLHTDYEARTAHLDAVAEDKANTLILATLFDAGAALRPPKDTSPSRNDFVSIETRRLLRIGNQLYAHLVIEERGKGPFHIEHVEVKEGKGPFHEVERRCSSNELWNGGKAICVIAVSKSTRTGDSFAIRITDKARGRTITAKGVAP